MLMARRETRILWIAGLLALVAFCGALVYRSAERSGAFDLDTVRITGIRQADSAAVCEIVAPCFGEPLSSLDLDMLECRLEELPGVDSARLSLAWPTTLKITADLSTPVLVLSDGAGCTPVSAACEPLPSTFLSDTLPVVTLDGPSDSASVAEVIRWLASGTPSGWEGSLVLGDGGLSVRLDGGRSVILGGGDLQAKWEVYRAVKDCALLDGEWNEMDLRFGGQAVLRIRE